MSAKSKRRAFAREEARTDELRRQAKELREQLVHMDAALEAGIPPHVRRVYAAALGFTRLDQDVEPNALTALVEAVEAARLIDA